MEKRRILKAWFTAATAAVSLAAIGADWAVSPKEASSIVRTEKERVKASLKDPESARFSSLYLAKRRSDGPKEIVLCGEVNAKNSYGGYSGARAFISSPSMVYLGDQIDALLPEFCADKIIEVK